MIANILLIIASLGLVCFAENAQATNKLPQSNRSKTIKVVKAETQPAQTSGTSAKPLSDAERIARLLRGLEQEKTEHQQLKNQLINPESEYAKAETDFQKLDKLLAEKKKQYEDLQNGGKTTEAMDLKMALEPLEKQWGLARDQFNLAIKERKIIQEKIAALERKIEDDQKALDQLTGKSQPASEAKDGNPTNGESNPNPPNGNPNATPQNEKTTGNVNDPATDKKPNEATPNNANGNGKTVDGKAKTGEETKLTPDAPPNAELVKAKEEAERKKKAAEVAKNRVQSVEERIKTIQKNIELEHRLEETARQKHTNALSSITELEKALHGLGGEDPSKITEIQMKLTEARERATAAKDSLEKSSERLDELNDNLRQLRLEEKNLSRVAEQKKLEADAAAEEVQQLQNPYTVHNILQWLLNYGPRVVAITIIMLVLNFLVRLSSQRIVDVMVKSSKRGSLEERENRANTLVAVFRSAATIVIFSVGIVMIMDTMGIPIVPLMGGAAVVGLAVAFGAQNLIRDYFSGFMVLMENQYAINDVVKIGDIAGKVEKITLRMTVLRDLKGIVHFIPHGTITHVSNMTHGYSRALLEVGVAYKENVDEVMKLLMEIAQDLRKDIEYSSKILEDPEMLGVDDFLDSAVMIKMVLKTRPLQQWQVRRELLRRIKNRFDELGIEIPFPHRTVYHHHSAQAELTIEDAGPMESRRVA